MPNSRILRSFSRRAASNAASLLVVCWGIGSFIRGFGGQGRSVQRMGSGHCSGMGGWVNVNCGWKTGWGFDESLAKRITETEILRVAR